jgi:hypothetical protein
VSQRLFADRLGPRWRLWRDSGERETAGRVNTMAAIFCVDCGLKLTGRYWMQCGRDYGATSAAQRASSPLATTTVQYVGSSAIAGAQQDVSSSTTGAQRAVSPTSRPARSLSAPTGTARALVTHVSFSKYTLCLNN